MKSLINKTVLFFAIVIAMTSCSKEAGAQPCNNCPQGQQTSGLFAGQSIYVTIDPNIVPSTAQSDQNGIKTYTALNSKLNIATYGTPADCNSNTGQPIDYSFWTLKFKRVGAAENASGVVVATKFPTLEYYDIIVSRDLVPSLRIKGTVFIAQVFAQPVGASSYILYNGVYYLDPQSTTKIVLMITGVAS